MKMQLPTGRHLMITGVLAFTLSSSMVCHAQPARQEPQAEKLVDPTGGLPVEATAKLEEYRIIKLRPKLAEPPAKSRLFPDRSDLVPGNAAPIFLRQNFEASTRMEKRKEFFRAEPGPMEKRLSDPNILAVQRMGLYDVGELERAACREHAGWEYPLYEPQYDGGGMYTLLPDVQESRITGLYLCELTRAAIAKGNVAQAERYLRIGLGVTRHLSETPFMVVKIVGSAQCSYYQFAMEELVQLPQSPNYYWDLASLPRPLIDPRPALEWERNVLQQAYPELLNLDALTTEQQWQKLSDKIWNGIHAVEDGRVPKPGTPAFEQLMDALLKKSRELLPRLDPNRAERVAKMSDAEALVRYWWIRVQQLQSTSFVPGLLEPHMAIELMQEREKQVAEMFVGEEFVLSSVMPFLSSTQLRFIYAKEQKFALLRTIEAIRHWIAEHDGKLPNTLSELTLPAPLDPLSGQAFEYEPAADGKSAQLHGKFIKLPEDTVKYGFSYRLELAD